MGSLDCKLNYIDQEQTLLTIHCWPQIELVNHLPLARPSVVWPEIQTFDEVEVTLCVHLYWHEQGESCDDRLCCFVVVEIFCHLDFVEGENGEESFFVMAGNGFHSCHDEEKASDEKCHGRHGGLCLRSDHLFGHPACRLSYHHGHGPVCHRNHHDGNHLVCHCLWENVISNGLFDHHYNQFSRVPTTISSPMTRSTTFEAVSIALITFRSFTFTFGKLYNNSVAIQHKLD